MTIDYIKNNNLLLFECISGSKAYGLDTPESDVDIRGVFYLPKNKFYGLNPVSQVNGEKNDETYYELGRFVELLLKNNPNMLELLCVPEDCILYRHPIMDKLSVEMFLSKLCKDTFAGYAISQVKKARGLNKKIVNPMSEERKSVLDFCYVIPPDSYSSVTLNEFMKRGYDQERFGLVSIPHMRDTYALFYDDYHKKEDTLYRGIVCKDNSNDVCLTSIPKDEIPVGILYFNKDGYSVYCKEYKEYWEWVEKRNKVRYDTTMSHGKQYDCYFDDETEFLTPNGWKKYDDICDNELVGTFNENRNLIFSPILSRTNELYTGNKYTYEDSYTRFSITENHNLFISPCHRTRYNNFSTKYYENRCDWRFIKVNDFFNGKRSYYHQINNLKNTNTDNEDFSDDFIKLLGLFLSDGTYIWDEQNVNNFRCKNDVKEKKKIAIRISQLLGDRTEDILKSISTIKFHYYEFIRDGRIETAWECRDTNVLKLLEGCVGRYSYEKEIPKYVFSFSNRQFELLLNSMIMGDGTFHKEKGHRIYYTTSYQMAKSLQTFLMLNGYLSQIYGNGDIPYDYIYDYDFKVDVKRICFQVFISKKSLNHSVINKTRFSKNIEKKKNRVKKNSYGWFVNDVENERIVCFETENNTLITRNKDKFSFHGNSKNMMHTIRLLQQSEEILTHGKLSVRVPNREELLAIRRGECEYDDLVEKAQSMINDIEILYDKSLLPDKPDADAVENVLVEMRKELYDVSEDNIDWIPCSQEMIDKLDKDLELKLELFNRMVVKTTCNFNK